MGNVNILEYVEIVLRTTPYFCMSAVGFVLEPSKIAMLLYKIGREFILEHSSWFHLQIKINRCNNLEISIAIKYIFKAMVQLW